VRTLWTLVGMGMWLLGASPLVSAQGAQPVTVTACLPCHGGEAAAPTFPKLDGQHAAYLDKQLREYKSGKRKSDIMAPLIAVLKKQQIPAMAAHFASQTPARGAMQNPQLANLGKVLYEEGNRASGVPGCLGCHLRNGVGYQRYPRLAGQRHRAAAGGLQERRAQQRPGARYARRGRTSHRRGDQSGRRVCRRIGVKVPLHSESKGRTGRTPILQALDAPHTVPGYIRRTERTPTHPAIRMTGRVTVLGEACLSA
jgi:cytochrome c553